MNPTFLLFLLLVRPRSILVKINFGPDLNLNEREFQEEKNMLIKRIEDLPKEHSYEFQLFYSFFPQWVSSKKSRKEIIDEISIKIYKVLPEGTRPRTPNIIFFKTLFENIASYDSRSVIYSGYTRLDDREVSKMLKLGFLVEIVSVKGLQYVDDKVTISSSDKVIGTRSCSEDIKQKKCEEGFVFSLPKNCYADYTPICICNTESLRKYGIRQEYPCPYYNGNEYCGTSCGEGMSEKNDFLIVLGCVIKTKSWKIFSGECLCLNVINSEIENTLCEDKSIGETCTYTCKKPNEFPKNEIVRCTINGWDNQMVCEKKKIVCRALAIENSEPISNSKTEYDIGDKYTVVCQSGFEKKGDVLTCQSTGEWTNNVSCEKSQMSLKLKFYLFNGLLFIFI